MKGYLTSTEACMICIGVEAGRHLPVRTGLKNTQAELSWKAKVFNK